ncbi:hypothetical protein PA25_14720 [Pseudoalteromonas sp. A25]|uniref:GrpB family protein n=1 Tax=Pseudoalteromonas sp. A25 TaxID=116092 RepID=UPI001260E1AF|nr:GrpB family protein [Pseudoalteromonas sp. A25]BBN81487.1 hypothetical protein PA25_14720 [Pseudoalteromonas sp. A25]
MSDAPIELADYNVAWPSMFEKEQALLKSAIGDYVVGSIEHIGSTSILGMPAKPIIDIMVGVKSLQHSAAAIPSLINCSYCYYPYKAQVMHWFCKPSPQVRSHHVHLVPFMSPLWQERIIFRNTLRENAHLALEYATLKQQLADNYGHDREAYTQKKWPFIKKILASYSD